MPQRGVALTMGVWVLPGNLSNLAIVLSLSLDCAIVWAQEFVHKISFDEILYFKYWVAVKNEEKKSERPNLKMLSYIFCIIFK